MATRSNAQQVSDAKLAEATGRERAAWYGLLDDAGRAAQAKDEWRRRLTRLAELTA